MAAGLIALVEGVLLDADHEVDQEGSDALKSLHKQLFATF